MCATDQGPTCRCNPRPKPPFLTRVGASHPSGCYLWPPLSFSSRPGTGHQLTYQNFIAVFSCQCADASDCGRGRYWVGLKSLRICGGGEAVVEERGHGEVERVAHGD